MLTKRQFEKLSAYDKGYACYMLGAREDEPNVPNHWEPPADHPIRRHLKRRYDAGQRHAVIHAQDCP